MSARRSAADRPGRHGRYGSWYHLVRRFFGFIASRPLTPREQSEVAALLGEAEAALFWQQGAEDQRHALTVARRTLTARPGDLDLGRAALLHDIGKRSISLGAVSRSLATVWARLGLPLRGAYRVYREHGPRGAEDLERAGVTGIAVAFARHHPGPAPQGIDPERWGVLLEADHA